ncbi:MAG TPA: zf-HC2 domain-containing protein [Ktedonobacterales bacterium]|nr:zf-HC2 domain-containing protein [Ktedonobacterales bacterium]
MSNDPEMPNMQWPDASAAPPSNNGVSPHLSNEQLAAWMANELGNDEYRAVRRHLEACGYCQRALAETRRIRALVMAAGSMLPVATPSVAERVLVRLPDRSLDDTLPLSAIPISRGGNVERARYNQRRGLWRRVGALAAVLLLIASSALLFSRISSRGQTNRPEPTAAPTMTPTVPFLGNWAEVVPAQATILDVAVVSQDDIWAAGLAGTDHGIEMLLMHYDGARWQVSPDTFDGAQLYSISMVSATEGWAAGSSNGMPFMLHYTSGHWRDATASIDTDALRDHKIILTQVRMATATSGWALGQGDQAPQHSTQILQYIKEGSTYRWEPTESFEGTTLNALSVVSNHEAWMVGVYAAKMIIMRVTVTYLNNDPNATITNWDTHSWETLGSGNLSSVSMLSSTDGWAGGGDGNGTGALFHWDGDQWTRVGIPSIVEQPGTVQGIVATGANAAWVYGEYPGTHSSYLYSIADGRWTDHQFSPSMDVHLVTGAALSPTELLAITDGATDDGANPKPMTFDARQGSPGP